MVLGTEHRTWSILNKCSANQTTSSEPDCLYCPSWDIATVLDLRGPLFYLFCSWIPSLVRRAFNNYVLTLLNTGAMHFRICRILEAYL